MTFVETAGAVTVLRNDVAVGSTAETSGALSTSSGLGSGSTAAVAGELGDDLFVVLGGRGGFGSLREVPTTTTGQRVRGVDVPSMRFPNGMGPFFSTVLPDGTIAMPHLQLAVNQVASTGTTMSMGFFHPDHGFYTVTVPTSLGVTDTFSVNSISGVVSAYGGADLSDSVLIWDGTTPVLFGLSAFFYRGWRASTVGLYPVMPAFVLSETTGRWVYDAARSVFPAQLRASHASGPSVWPNTVNFYGETVVDGLLPAEMVVLPRSQHVALSIYAPRSGHNWGSVCVVDPLTKSMKAWYEWPDLTNTFGWGTRSFTRDINADPSSATNAERIVCNHDVFMQPNETFNVVVWADSGTWRVSYNGVQSSVITVGAWAADVRTALETIPALSGKVSVKESRPFLVGMYVVYEVELIGSLAHTDLTATPITINTASLVNDGGSRIARWRHGSTGYDLQSTFPFSELEYNAGAGTLTLKTVPMFPQHGTEDPSRGEAPDATAGMTWYTASGDLVVAVAGHNGNPDAFTSFTGYGCHVYVKPAGGDRAYVAAHAPTTGWEARYGEARPTPDQVTTPLHQDGNAFMLGLCEDTASGGLLVPCASGKLLGLHPHGRWVPRSGRLVRPGTFASSGDVTANWAASGGAVGYSSGETAMSLTPSSTADMLVTTPTGTSGLPITSEQIGEVVSFAVEAKAATTRRLIRMACRFWNSSGTEVGQLTGYGSSVSYDTTGGYRRIVGSTVIPTGTAYLSFQIEILDPAAAEVHYVRKVDINLAGYWPTPGKLDMGTYPLYIGQAGGSWTAKGFVDQQTRMAWFPYLQVMSEATARTGRFPSWLVRVNTAKLFELDRRPAPRRMTATRWSQSNPVLELGEYGQESDTRKAKVGDGSTDWVTLGYLTT